MVLDETRQSRKPTHVVGVGASAGGLEALEKLFETVPVDTGMAFAVVQHLSPDFKSLMDELLARFTSLRILAAEDGMELESNTIYLMPPKKEMRIDGSLLRLSAKKVNEGLSLPINTFLKSLAEEWQEKSVAVILSGTGSDGSEGIRHVARMGGLVMCQSSESAQFDGMPRSAEKTGAVDVIRPPEEIGVMLKEYAASRGMSKQGFLDKNLTSDPDSLSQLFSLLRTKFEIDFKDYKPGTIMRRIERRISITSTGDLPNYLEKISESEEELDTLYKDLLIGVTSFFRDPQAFVTLKHQVLPELLRAVESNGQFRAWVAGCSTGEEAYSLAMAIREVQAEHHLNVDVKIFATDVNKSSLEIASSGNYSADEIATLTPEQKSQNFTITSDGYQVISDIRQMIVFAPHNLAVDAPFTKLDFITCRNMLIYLQQNVQNKILALFHFALKKNGVLFLGPSESLGSVAASFSVLDNHWKMYRKSRDSSHPNEFLSKPINSLQKFTRSNSHRARKMLDERSLTKTYDKLLDFYMPAGILLNDQRELIHVFGNASQYVQLRTGRPSTDATELVPVELQSALKGAMHRAQREMTHVQFSGLRMPNVDSLVRMSVLPIPGDDGLLAHMMITFETLELPSVPITEVVEPDDLTKERMQALENELNLMRDNLQSTVEELETSNEELQATNEEMVASNEELQSTNEELHSVNEELYTVNAEYQRKISELTEIKDDIDHVFEHLEVGMVFLDKDLVIRKFNRSVSTIFSLQPQDVGRFFGSFTHTLQRINLIDDIKRVMHNDDPFEKEVRDIQGRCYVLRVHSYRSAGEVDGAVLELVDVSDVKKSRSQLRTEIHRLTEVIDNDLRHVCVTDLDGNYLFMNKGYADFSGLDRSDLTFQNYNAVLPGEAPKIIKAADDQVLSTNATVVIPDPVLLGTMLTPCQAEKFPIRNELGEIESIGTFIKPLNSSSSIPVDIK